MMNLETNTRMNWVAAWYAAPVRMLSAGLSGRTFRQQVHLHAGGSQVRVRLSNRYGDDAITLSSVSVENVNKNPLLVSQAHVVHFEGNPTVTLKPGQEIMSDPVTMQVDAFSNLTITFYLAQGEALTGHSGARQISSISGIADVTKMPREASFLAYPLLTASWWLISGVDVLPSHPLNAVVTFGSSTTDGYGSTPNENRRWPDYLARRLADAGEARFMSVINAGIDANQLTSSAIPIPPGLMIPPFLFGDAGLQRLNWDVLAQPGATDLIVHIGSNDLRLEIAGSTVIEGFQQLSQQVRKTYRKVFGTTILPGGYSASQAEQYQLVNTWIREQGHQWFDAVFDFASALASPDQKAVLNPLYDSGDGLHPNDEGYRVMADAVDISQLSGSPDAAT